VAMLRFFHPLVSILLVGTIFVRTASFMTIPFLAIYLQNELGADPITIGITLGAAALFATFGGIIGGYLTDRFGRKTVILATLAIYTLVFIGFASVKIVGLFIILNALNGFARSTFEPATQALMIDFTENEKKRRLFSIRYTAINIAAVIGPLIGVGISKWASPVIPFLITACMYAIYAIFLFFVFKRFDLSSKYNNAKAKFAEMLFVISKDQRLIYLLIGGMFISFGYSQINSTLPQILSWTITDAVEVYSILIALNALVVIIFQFPVSVLAEKWSLFKTLSVGVCFFALGFVGFAVSVGPITFGLAMVVFTMGEILSFPPKNALIEQIAPDNQKAMYLGASQLSNLGGFAGPVIGGWLILQMQNYSYFIMAFILLISIIFYWLSFKKMENYINR